MTDKDLGQRFLIARRELRRAIAEEAAHRSTLWKMCAQLANAGRKAILEPDDILGFEWSENGLISKDHRGQIGKWPSFETVAEEARLLHAAQRRISQLNEDVEKMDAEAANLDLDGD